MSSRKKRAGKSPKKEPGVNIREPAEESLKVEVGGRKAEEEPNSEITKSEIEIPKSEIKMEVHHHPEVEKKTFKEYLLEGLMIFIAVMMGFFAESLREHINEKDRAEEYAVTLKSDLKLDTAELRSYIAYYNRATASVDSLMALLSDTDPKRVPSGKLYWFGLWGGAYRLFLPHDATLLEMKSSGSLRFFGDKLINRRLAQYDQLCQSSRVQETGDQQIYTEVRKARAKLFEFKYNEVVNNISATKDTRLGRAKIDSFKKTSPPLLSYDKVLINEYVEMVRSRFFYRKVQAADTLLRHSTELIGLLDKKYELGNE